jgi:hypothetical protein
VNTKLIFHLFLAKKLQFIDCVLYSYFLPFTIRLGQFDYGLLLFDIFPIFVSLLCTAVRCSTLIVNQIIGFIIFTQVPGSNFLRKQSCSFCVIPVRGTLYGWQTWRQPQMSNKRVHGHAEVHIQWATWTL